MRSLCAVVAVLAAAVISRTAAMAPCDTKIVELLKTTKECYKDGTVPNVTPPAGRHTYVRLSGIEVKADTHCLTVLAKPGSAEVKVYGEGNTFKYNCEVKQKEEEDHLLETDKDNKKSKLYVISNEANVYSFYKCIADHTEGDGKHMGAVAVACGKADDAGSKAVIKRAEECFQKIGIRNVKTINACDGEVCK